MPNALNQDPATNPAKSAPRKSPGLGRYRMHRHRIHSPTTTGIFVLALLAALHLCRDFILPVMLAFVSALALRPIVRAMNRIHIPDSVGAGVLVVALVGALALGSTSLYEPAMEWTQRAPDTLRKVERRLQALHRKVEDLGRAAAEVEELTKMNDKKVASVKIEGEDLQTTLTKWTADIGGGAVVVFVLLYFVLATRAQLLGKALALLVAPEQRETKASIVAETERNISRYLFTVSMINAVLGVAMGCGMWAWGMPNALLWGVMAGLLNFVPYLGAVAGVSITALVAIVTFDDLRWVAVPLTYLALTSLEGMLITPAILGRRFSLDPVVVFLWIVFWGWLWGLGGALLAMPMLVVLRITSERAQMGHLVRLISAGDSPAAPAGG